MTTQFTRRKFSNSMFGLATGVLTMPSFMSSAHAQAFPGKSKPIRVISPFSSGSSPDTLARVYAQSMSEILGVSVIVENKPGAEGVIGIQAIKDAPADGYTVLFTTISTQVVNPHLFKRLPYDPLKEHYPLMGTMKVDLMLFAGPSVQEKNIGDFLRTAKAKPGKFTCASYTATTRLAGKMIADGANIELVNVPYKSIADLVSNLIGGSVDTLISDVPTMQPYLSRGIRPLAVASSKRLSNYPDVPTLSESGVQGGDIFGWHAAYVSANTPAPIIAILTDAIRKASGSKAVTDYFKTFGIEGFDLSGDKFVEFQRAEYEKWGKAVKEAGLAGTL